MRVGKKSVHLLETRLGSERVDPGMAHSAVDSLKDWLLTRLTPRYRPVLRTFEQTFPFTSKIEIDVHTGSLRVLAASNFPVIQVTTDVRSRDPHVAGRIGVASHVEGEKTRVYFTGPFTENHRTCASVDATIIVPRDASLSIRNHLGGAAVIGAGGTCEVRCGGVAEIVLAPGWNGESITAKAGGQLKLSVPRSVVFAKAPSLRSSLGKVVVNQF
jgi:hypothetical protein